MANILNFRAGLFFILMFSIDAIGSTSLVNLKWQYEKFPIKMQTFQVKPEKSPFISETAVVKTLKEAPISTEVKGKVSVVTNGSTSLVLVVNNESDKDIYFFAVPHELHPHHASAGHYFECLCVGRLFKVPAKSVWYRIVRINLNESFQKVKSFDITHKIIGVSKEEAQSKYKDRLYE